MVLFVFVPEKISTIEFIYCSTQNRRWTGTPNHSARRELIARPAAGVSTAVVIDSIAFAD
jgi:hypothetical protein